MKTTWFRRSADDQLRDAVCDLAADSRHANPWAAQLDQQAGARGHRHPPASDLTGEFPRAARLLAGLLSRGDGGVRGSRNAS